MSANTPDSTLHADPATWIGLSTAPLDPAAALDFVRHRSCGAAVLFTGTVRDHHGDRLGVTSLRYEAYEEMVEPRLEAAVAAVRAEFPDLVRIVAIHRIGSLHVEDDAVLVAVSSPHRHEAFGAASALIDRVKQTVPIWKFETWQDGSGWSSCDDDAATPT